VSEIELTPFDEVLARYKNGEMLIMVDESDRENEGDFIVATEAATLEHVNTMLKVGRGLMCVSISDQVAAKLDLPLQTSLNNSLFHTAFTVSLDLKNSLGLGATASNRLACMKALTDDNIRADDFIVPGNVFPLIANKAGTLGRLGQTEGSSDLAALAGFKRSSLLCEILNEDGTMMRGDALIEFARSNNYALTSVKAVSEYRIKNQANLRKIKEFSLNIGSEECRATIFFDDASGNEHLALVFGKIIEPATVRVHSECLTGDIFGSRRCDCGPQLSAALKIIENNKSGILIYLRQEGRGIGLSNKLKAYQLQDQGLDTVEANQALGFAGDLRSFDVAASILKQLGVSSVRLITNNPDKQTQLEAKEIQVLERIGLVVDPDDFNSKYLQTKKEKLGHFF
jgi:3,4-dihydroxy 2-butanone 4-phosphate synthase/GTP cyclohydrolase II